jgi:hypothetical protein
MPSPTPTPPTTPQSRGVFSFYDGVAEVWGDPLEIETAFILACGGDADALFKAAQLPPANIVEHPPATQSRLMAQAKLVDATRVAFGMAPFDKATGKGATAADCIRALNRFTDWLEKNA